MEKVDTEELQELGKKLENLLIINVLPEDEFEQAHIPGSLNIPAMDKDFVQRVKRKANGNDTPIAVYCADEHCGLADTAAKRLEAAGFENVYEYPGGTKAWAESNLELEGRGPNEPEHQEDEQEADEGDEKMATSKQKSKPKSKAAKSKSEEKESSASSAKDGGKKTESAQKKAKGGAKPIRREASAQWKGTIKDGTGAMRLGASRAIELPYSFSSRFESAEMTNPEELIGAAHAGCFSMALAKVLEDEGYSPQSLETKATVALEKENGGFRIASIKLEVTGDIEDIDEDEFDELAQKAGENCPVSKALADPEITVTAKLGA